MVGFQLYLICFRFEYECDKKLHIPSPAGYAGATGYGVGALDTLE